jgi:hypothetical protein
MKRSAAIALLVISMAASSYLLYTHLRQPKQKKAREADISSQRIIVEKTFRLESGIVFRFGRFEGLEQGEKSFVTVKENRIVGKLANRDLARVAGSFFGVKLRYISQAPDVQSEKIAMEYEYPRNIPEEEVGKALLSAFGLVGTLGETQVPAYRISAREQVQHVLPERLGTSEVSFSETPDHTKRTMKFSNEQLGSLFANVFIEQETEFIFDQGLWALKVTSEVTYASPEDALEKLCTKLNLRSEPTTTTVRTLYVSKLQEQ